MCEERLQALEEKLAYVEMANSQLSDEIYRHRQELDTLTRAHRKLLNRLDSIEESVEQGGGVTADQPPPHY